MANTKIVGFRELSRQLERMATAAQGKVIRSAVTRATTPVVREARNRIPIAVPPYESSGDDPYPITSSKGILRTPGFAKRSIAKKVVVSRDKTFGRAMVGVKPEAWYAFPFAEFGTSKIPKRPWLDPAFRSQIPKMDAEVARFLKIAIDKAARKK